MDRAVILHGTDSCPHKFWVPWLKDKLKAAGHKVWVPILPNSHTPNAKTYNNFIFSKDKDYSDNIVIGHSSGGVAALNMLMDKRCPKIKLGVVISAWADSAKAGIPQEQFKDLFPKEGFDFKTIKSKAENLLFVHGQDDPYCPLDQARWLAKQSGAELLVVDKGHHLGKARDPEFPELLEGLKRRNVL